MSESRKSLSDILHNGGKEKLTRQWKATTAAEERGPLPRGEYTFRIAAGALFTSNNGTPGYKLTLEVAQGEYEGRRAWHDLWLSDAALKFSKRDLAKIGVTDPEQLERPLPPGILIRGLLMLRRGDNGTEFNKLTRFECIGTEPSDAFEPVDAADDASSDPTPPEAGSGGRRAGPLAEPWGPPPQTNGSHLGDRR